MADKRRGFQEKIVIPRLLNFGQNIMYTVQR